MVKTMKISDDTHRELTMISAEYTTRDGVRRTFDETIMALVEAYRAKKDVK
ncbi:MAG TPA: hypothetical protein VIH27_01025 [Nitrososphaerales archaeon]